jgi:TP901 family phage tail tape measure protein
MMASEIISVILNLTDNLSRGIDQATAKVDSFGAKAGKLANAFAPVSLAAGGALGISIKLAADFDKSVTGAARALNLTGGEVEKFKVSMQGLQKELGYQFSQSALANIATDAGKLGVAKEQINDFTKTIAKLAVATDQTKNIGELSTNAAKISSLFKLSTKEFESFGAAVNKLDDSFALTANDLIDFTKRAGGLASSAKISANQTAAWGATLLNAGRTAETSGTFMNKFVNVMGTADVASRKAKLGFAQLGIDTKELARAFDKDANGAMLQFLTKLNAVDNISKREIIARIFGQEHVGTASLLAGQTDNLAKALGYAADEQGNLTKLQSEFDKQSNSVAGQMEKFKNQASALGIQLGTALLPGILAVMGALSPMLEMLVKLTQQHPMISTLIVTALGVVAIIAPVLALVSAISSIVAALPILGGALAAVAGVLAALLSPITLVVAGFVGLGFAAVAIIKNWTPIKGFFAGLWDGVISSGNRFVSWVNTGLNGAVKSANAGINHFAASANASINSFVSGGVAKIQGFFSWLGGLGSNFASMAVSWGQGLLQGFINGIQSMYGQVQNVMNTFTSWLAQYLPHSDAKKGALSNLTASGAAFADTFMSGIAGSNLDPFGTIPEAGGYGSISPASSGSGSTSMNFAPVYNISAKDSDDILKQLKERDRELLDLIKRANTRTDRRAY